MGLLSSSIYVCAETIDLKCVGDDAGFGALDQYITVDPSEKSVTLRIDTNVDKTMGGQRLVGRLIEMYSYKDGRVGSPIMIKKFTIADQASDTVKARMKDYDKNMSQMAKSFNEARQNVGLSDTEISFGMAARDQGVTISSTTVIDRETGAAVIKSVVDGQESPTIKFVCEKYVRKRKF